MAGLLDDYRELMRQQQAGSQGMQPNLPSAMGQMPDMSALNQAGNLARLNQAANQAPPPQQPRSFGDRAMGILGAIGGGIKKRVQDPNFADRLVIGLGGMTMNPNEALMRQASANIEQRRAMDLLGKQANQTAEWLKTQPGGAAYAQLLMDNPTLKATDVIAMYKADKDRSKDPEAIRVRQSEAAALGYEPGSDEYQRYIAEGSESRLSFEGKADMEDRTRNRLNQDLDRFGFFDVREGFNTVKEFYERPSGISDYALTIAFLKILDPGSVVRGEEVNALNRSTALAPALKAQMLNAITGEGLMTQETRNTIAKLAQSRYAVASEQANEIIDQTRSVADNYGLNFDNVRVGISVPSPQIDMANVPKEPGVVPPVPANNSELVSILSQYNMTYEEFVERWPTLIQLHEAFK